MMIELSKILQIKPYLQCTKPARRLASLLLINAAILSGNALGQGFQPDVDFAPNQQKLEWFPGEAYNGLNGTMNYRQTDLYLPGTGNLPIEVTRYYDQTHSTHEKHTGGNFGRFTFDIPRVTLYSKSNRANTGYCKKNGGFVSSAASTLPLTLAYGGSTRVFRASGDRLVSKDGWTAECVENRGTIGTLFALFGTLVLRRPDGVTYEMRLHFYNVNSLSSLYTLHKTTDTYGNWLTYVYDKTSFDDVRAGIISTTPAVIRLNSIVAKDGRKVKFSYISDNFSNGFRGKSSYHNIRRIESNSSDNPIVVDYQYLDDFKTIKVTRNSLQTTTIETSNNSIEKITYPTVSLRLTRVNMS